MKMMIVQWTLNHQHQQSMMNDFYVTFIKRYGYYYQGTVKGRSQTNLAKNSPVFIVKSTCYVHSVSYLAAILLLYMQ
jgi:hypothetical protein